jgi:hypothetical protein
MIEQISRQAVSTKSKQCIAALTASQRAAAAIQRNLNRRMVVEKYLFGVVKGWA